MNPPPLPTEFNSAAGIADAGEAILAELIILLRPRRLVCIGNDAANAALRLAGLADVVKVRHPSYGGQRDFLSQIRGLYGLQSPAPAQMRLASHL